MSALINVKLLPTLYGISHIRLFYCIRSSSSSMISCRKPITFFLCLNLLVAHESGKLQRIRIDSRSLIVKLVISIESIYKSNSDSQSFSRVCVEFITIHPHPGHRHCPRSAEDLAHCVCDFTSASC